MSPRFLVKDEERVSRRAGTLRLVAAASGVVGFAFAVLTFASSATAWICIGIAAVAVIGLIAVLSRLRQTRATLLAMRAELRADP